MNLNAERVRVGLTALGKELAADAGLEKLVSSPIRLVIAGGAAGRLAGEFRAARSTIDCDVPWDPPDPASRAIRERIRGAGERVAAALGLAKDWVNFKCVVYAWKWPVGWQERCEPVAGDFGPLEGSRLARIDLIAAKVMGAPKGAQDRLDLRDLAPTDEELNFVEDHLDRLEAEHPNREEMELERIIVADLRGSA